MCSSKSIGHQVRTLNKCSVAALLATSQHSGDRLRPSSCSHCRTLVYQPEMGGVQGAGGGAAGKRRAAAGQAWRCAATRAAGGHAPA